MSRKMHQGRVAGVPVSLIVTIAALVLSIGPLVGDTDLVANENFEGELFCEDGPFPECLGACPQGTTCVQGPNECICVEVVCEQSPFPECMGLCPPGEDCMFEPAFQSCLCFPQFPCDQAFPECNGTCPQGEECRDDGTGNACACLPPACELSVFPECGGECPPNMTCKEDPANEACFCEPLPCEAGPYPQCGGDCPAGTLCEPAAAAAVCHCRPESNECSQCPGGDHFVDNCGPFPPVGVDLVADDGAHVGIDLDLDCVEDMSLVLLPCPAPDHQLRIHKVAGPLDDSLLYPGTRPVDGHLDVIDTEIVSMCLTDGDSGVTLMAGAGSPSAIQLYQSLGNVAEKSSDPSYADSFFDVYFEVSGVPGGPAYNQAPLRKESVIDCLPPAARYHSPGLICIPLYTAGTCNEGPHDGLPCVNESDCPDGSCVGEAILANLISAIHTPNRSVCGEEPFPECIGDCPPGEVCMTDTINDACVCAPLPCEQSEYPLCAGGCPPGEQCLTGVDACFCAPVTCEQSQAPECGGDCPPGQACFEIAGGCECQPLACDQTWPECGGECPAGTVCRDVGGACACEPLQCSETQAPECNGECPPDTHCEAVTSGADLPSPDLPPESNPPECEQIVSMYAGVDLHAMFPGGIDFSDPQHKCFENVQRDPVGPDEIEVFDSTVEGLVNLGAGPIPVTLTGPVQIVTFGKAGNTTGTFDTEMVSMSLTGDVGGIPIEIRESPNLASQGETTITDIGGGLYHIDSFFDVFTELSIDGGPFEAQINEPGRMELIPTGAGACQCVDDIVPCDQSQAPECGGECPTGEICVEDPTGQACACELLPCDQTFPECGGECPIGTICAMNADGNDCVCELLPCHQTWPECGGECPVGMVCRNVGGACACGPPLCSDTPAPECNGECPPDTHCEEIREGADLPSADLPPESDPTECDQIVSQYEGQDLHAMFPGGIDFSNPIHKCFQNVQREDIGEDEMETFDSTVEGMVDVGNGPVPVTLTGPMQVITYDRLLHTTGLFDTEIVSMSLSGDAGGVPIMIRESPTQVSPGQTDISDLGGGLYHIDSFFDVFTELSVDGGENWLAQENGPGRMRLVPTGPGHCACVDDVIPCEQTFPECGGECPPDTHCEPGTSDGVVLPWPDLPPESDPQDPDCVDILSQYAGQGVHALFPGGIDFSDPLHKCFKNVDRQDDGSGNEIETFDSTVDGQVDLGGGPVPVTLTGPVQIVTYGKTGNTTGNFATEIVAMSLTGDVGGIPIEIRESPSQTSPGQTAITDLGGGLWQIDSFFDVFTELSVNGGPFQPQTNGPGRMGLVPTNPDNCECVPDQVPCEDSDPATCDGFCPNAGDVCNFDPGGGPCSCGPPPPPPCEETFPTCDGDCPPDTHCEPGTSGGVVLPWPDLPPESDPPDPDCVDILSQYAGQGVHALFPGGVEFSDPLHKCFKNVDRQDDGSGNEIETFNSTVEGQVDLGGGPVPVTLTGPVTIVTLGKTGNTTGTFQTEMVSMSLTGNAGGVPIEIRESPSLPSPGQTAITDLGGGLYHIDSFFDVSTELSVSGGPFQPQTNDPGHMTLVPVNPDTCECVPDVFPCDQTWPECGGECPPGEICGEDATGQGCVCQPPATCEDTFFPECDGTCPQGTTCVNVIGTDHCECVPEGPECESTQAPMCNGSCPPDERCVDQGNFCGCEPCDAVVPSPVDGVHWLDKARMRWAVLPCALVYNVYELTAIQLTDSDGDGVADSYGTCLLPNRTVPEVVMASVPPLGFVSFYQVTGENSVGEGSMGFNSRLMPRPNVTPCP